MSGSSPTTPIAAWSSSLETAELTAEGFKDVGTGPGSIAGDYIAWHTIADHAGAVADDVTRIRQHPLVPPTIPVYGYLTSGRLVEVEAATRAGAMKTVAV